MRGELEDQLRGSQATCLSVPEAMNIDWEIGNHMEPPQKVVCASKGLLRTEGSLVEINRVR